MIRRLAILGVGLIGGSLALALKRTALVETVVGYGRGRDNLELALRQGVIDALADTPETAVAGAELAVLAVPVGSMPWLMQRIAPVLAPDAVLTDVGSTKQDVVAAAEAHLGPRLARFVPGHPIAGAEASGVAAAHADLFRGKEVILTPLPHTDPLALERVQAMWQGCGAQVLRMPPALHDRIFAAVSHLPHLAAFALMDELAGRDEAELYFRHAGSGFRDFTRIAGSHPEMWRDIALANRAALVAELDAYIARLRVMRELVAAGDGEALMQLLTRASRARRLWTQHWVQDRPK
ncbi:MAG: prephenate dehydrogenase/arogenate dehydrogenase family protein [Thiobacillaceae bacterium]|nr:prephenate dehydrogenase/arogenate dehydrogenase family protein [Thiobacillaceae bacterium]